MEQDQKNGKCDPCEERFEENVDEIVDEVEGYSDEDRRKKEKEVEEAFADSKTDSER